MTAGDDVSPAEMGRRLDRVESKLDSVVEFFADPSKTALGREVITRAERNAARIGLLEEDRDEDRIMFGRRFERIEGWIGIEDPPVPGRLPLWTMMERGAGVLQAIRIAILLLTVIATILGIWAIIGKP